MQGKMIIKEYDSKIIAEYKKGKSFQEIGEIVGLTKDGVAKRIRKLIFEGRLDKRANIQRKRPTATKHTGYRINEKTVNCTNAICKSCVYGYEVPTVMHKCRFALCTGVCRSLLTNPPNTARQCPVYERITSTNPRRKDLEDELC